MEIVEEKIKMLTEQEEFAFIKDIPHEQLWKLAFALNFIQESDWIPVKYRDMTQEEIERYSEYTEATKMFDCKMPDDGQDILVSTRSGIVTTDVCDIDDMYGYGLEDYGDWEDIVAWMPLPEPYKAESEG